jgi:hypothetical protein
MLQRLWLDEPQAAAVIGPPVEHGA